MVEHAAAVQVLLLALGAILGNQTQQIQRICVAVRVGESDDRRIPAPCPWCKGSSRSSPAHSWGWSWTGFYRPDPVLWHCESVIVTSLWSLDQPSRKWMKRKTQCVFLPSQLHASGYYAHTYLTINNRKTSRLLQMCIQYSSSYSFIHTAIPDYLSLSLSRSLSLSVSLSRSMSLSLDLCLFLFSSLSLRLSL